MNPHGGVVNENTNGIVTVNGHSYEDPAMHTENTNFALLVSKHFTCLLYTSSTLISIVSRSPISSARRISIGTTIRPDVYKRQHWGPGRAFRSCPNAY